MSCQNIFVFTFLQCRGKVAFFETKMWVFIESKVKSCKTKDWRPSVQWGYTSIQKPAFNKPVLRKWRGLLELQHILLIACILAGLP